MVKVYMTFWLCQIFTDGVSKKNHVLRHEQNLMLTTFRKIQLLIQLFSMKEVEKDSPLRNYYGLKNIILLLCNIQPGQQKGGSQTIPLCTISLDHPKNT